MGIQGTSAKKDQPHPLFGLGNANADLKDRGWYALDIMITLVAIAKLPTVASALMGPVKRSPQVEISRYMDSLMEKCQVESKNIKLVFVFDGLRLVANFYDL